jgi:transcriptional regulator with XRE-family HTH domain
MLQALGQHLRERRKAAGLSQVQAADAAGIGRSTLLHLEHGRKDIRISNVMSVAAAIGASLGLAGEEPEAAERLRLRAMESMKLARRREAHMRLALDLALGRPGARAALADARRMVQVWKKGKTCSRRYIDAWSRILEGRPADVAARIRDIDAAWLDALLQNTPFPRTALE